MIDLGALTNDILQNSIFFLTPAALWLFLYLFAWEKGELATRLGFGRGTFWLLLPGSFLGSVANLPFFPWNGDILAINIGGGLIPVVLALMLLLRTVDLPRNALLGTLALFAGESLTLLVVVETNLPASVTLEAVFGIAAVPSVGLIVWASTRPALQRSTGIRVGFFLALTSGLTVVMFLTTAAVPGLGIVSAFPDYLVAPIGAGALATVLMRAVFHWPLERSLPIAYSTTTLGVLIGADLLREPPLYAPGTAPALFAIGGAGFLDLLYLSGLLALAAAYLSFRLLQGESPTLVGSIAVRDDPPGVKLRAAWKEGTAGRVTESLAFATSAVRDAAAQADLLAGQATATASGPRSGAAPAAPWLVVDQRNFENLVHSGTSDPGEAFRAWQTCRWLVRASLQSARSRFARWSQRTWAFAIDLVIVTLPALGIFALIVATAPGTATQILVGVPLNAAVLGYSSYALAYFVLAELLFGHTLGKSLMHLSVYRRNFHPIGGIPALVRNLPKLIPLSTVGAGLEFIVVALIKGASLFGTLPFGSAVGLAAGLTAALVGLGVGIVVMTIGAVSVFVISRSHESQRVGDFLAGTWVVNDRPTAVRVGPPTGAVVDRFG